ncbi:conserved Plasmodium protein, unknown function [Plasmodium ovale]|uniref:PUB domain-containing protein n=1 Tax=Plasmodium ovale TaxID=36330 RepID=A0A1C3L4E8_PLAOA|nr:conserved Plasmodium protein, unknown function [Plasmodium ovale]
MDEENEVVKLILRVGKKINKSAKQLEPFIKTIVEDNWLDSMDSLRKLSDDEWNILKLPIRLLDEIKSELRICKEDEKKKIENSDLSEHNILGKGKNNKKGTLTVEEKENERENVCLNKKMKKDISNEDVNGHMGSINNRKNDNNDGLLSNIIYSSTGGKTNTSYIDNDTISKDNIHSGFDTHDKEKTSDVTQLRNHGFPTNSIIKCYKEKLENFIKNNIKDIQKEDIFYMSYYNEKDKYICGSYSEEKTRTINSINETEKLKNIDISDLKYIIPILCKIVKNILINPNLINTRILKSTNDIMKNKILKYNETKNFLLSIGFVQIHTFYVMERVDTLLLLCIYESLQNIAKDSIKIGSPPKAAFDPFKSSILSVDTLKKGKLKIDEPVDKLLKQKMEHVEKLMNQRIDLNPKIYAPQENATANASEGGNKNVSALGKGSGSLFDSDKEDEEAEDLAYLIPNIKNLYKEQTFKSKTKLELEKISTRKIYSKAVLKILFPDSYVLEMSFSAGTFIKEVNESIKQFLSESVTSREWYIYETPGISKFDPHKKLSDYNLIPSALLRFKVDDKDNSAFDGSFLSEEAIAKYSFKL